MSISIIKTILTNLVLLLLTATLGFVLYQYWSEMAYQVNMMPAAGLYGFQLLTLVMVGLAIRSGFDGSLAKVSMLVACVSMVISAFAYAWVYQVEMLRFEFWLLLLVLAFPLVIAARLNFVWLAWILLLAGFVLMYWEYLAHGQVGSYFQALHLWWGLVATIPFILREYAAARGVVWCKRRWLRYILLFFALTGLMTAAGAAVFLPTIYGMQKSAWLGIILLIGFLGFCYRHFLLTSKDFASIILTTLACTIMLSGGALSIISQVFKDYFVQHPEGSQRLSLMILGGTSAFLVVAAIGFLIWLRRKYRHQTATSPSQTMRLLDTVFLSKPAAWMYGRRASITFAATLVCLACLNLQIMQRDRIGTQGVAFSAPIAGYSEADLTRGILRISALGFEKSQADLYVSQRLTVGSRGSRVLDIRKPGAPVMQGEYRGEALPDGRVAINYHSASYTMRAIYNLTLRVVQKLERLVSTPSELDFADTQTTNAFGSQSGLVGTYYFPREQFVTLRQPLTAEMRVSKSGEIMIIGVTSTQHKLAVSEEHKNPSAVSAQLQEADKRWEQYCAGGKNKTSAEWEKYCQALEKWRFNAQALRQLQK
jgi:hypothetical protein